MIAKAGIRCLLLLFLIGTASYPVIAQPKPGVFKQDWEKLKQEVPDWFQDAKFGIYFHWGVYAVPAYNSEWYSRGMYQPGSKSNKYHVTNYGTPEKFGYKDFIPLFKAEKFNADEWVDLFVRAGAKFAGPVAEHADGFSMWDSRVNPWNAKDMGPRRDIVGEMEKAVRKRNLKFITTFHHQWQWGWYPTFNDSLDVGNPQYAGLYGPVISRAAWQHQETAEKPDAAFAKVWLAKVKEVIKKYQPDLLYFDSRLGHIGEEYRKEVVSAFANKNKKPQRNKVLLYKGSDLPEVVGVRTHEKSRMNQVGNRPWLTEETVSTYSWCYTQDMVLRPAEDMLHGLIDIVSKNGVYLLNISPKADGTIPAEQKEILLKIGDWMQENGEAIYGSRPWYTYGEGPRKEVAETEEGQQKKFYELKYTAADIRYTVKGNNIYALFLGQPAPNEPVVLKSFANSVVPGNLKISRVTMLGTNKEVPWQLQDSGLALRFPTQVPEKMATVIRIETTGKL